MCGICGFVGPRDPHLLARMLGALVHRGPDGTGVWEGERASFAMRRLAIVDVEQGGQPVFNEDQSVVLVFNGEIYNHTELRSMLLARGHQFRSHHSDSEVIVHLYEEYGTAFLEHLNGMFALAIWDEQSQRLLLARDRAGIKPLFYTWVEGVLYFASEIKALLKHPQLRKQPDYAALHHYFSFKHVPAPLTAFTGVRQLKAGEMGVLQRGTLAVSRWWALNYRVDERITEQDATQTIRQLLQDSVRLQMQSDVPVGAYLSGGVDSSSVVAFMAQQSSQALKTFTLTYDGGSAQKNADRDFARQVAKQYCTDHVEVVLRPQQVLDDIDNVVDAFDEPFSGVISTYFLTHVMAKHVKVALSGDGADELFGSYLPHRLAQPLAAMAAGAEVAAIEGYSSADLRAIIARGDEAARRMAQTLYDEAEKMGLYSAAMRIHVGESNTEQWLRASYDGCASTDPLNRALHVDFENLLPDQVLCFVDRLSMAHSLEVRPPFLDHRLMEYVGSLPGSLKICAGRVKHILKCAVADLLPPALIDRPKEGFLMPLNAWLQKELAPWAGDVLARAARNPLFSAAAITQLQLQGQDGLARALNRQWNVVMFQLWWERHFG